MEGEEEGDKDATSLQFGWQAFASQTILSGTLRLREAHCFPSQSFSL